MIVIGLLSYIRPVYEVIVSGLGVPTRPYCSGSSCRFSEGELTCFSSFCILRNLLYYRNYHNYDNKSQSLRGFLYLLKCIFEKVEFLK